MHNWQKSLALLLLHANHWKQRTQSWQQGGGWGSNVQGNNAINTLACLQQSCSKTPGKGSFCLAGVSALHNAPTITAL